MITKGSYVHEPMVKFSLGILNFFPPQNFQHIGSFRQNNSQGFFIFTIYQNYTLALTYKMFIYWPVSKQLFKSYTSIFGNFFFVSVVSHLTEHGGVME